MADPRCSWLLTLVVCFVVFVGSVKSLEEDTKSTCIHDDIALPIKKGPPSEGGDQKRELPSEPDSHIRIHVHPDESLLNSEDYSHLYLDKTSVLWRAIDTYVKGLLVRPLTEPATIAPTCERFTSGIFGGFCKNGTLELECGIFEYPGELAGEQYVCDAELVSCGFEGDVGEGVEADYIMIVGALDHFYCGNYTLAFASACNVEYDYFRPINGYFNLCPRNLGIISELDDILYAVILHEMTHAMGFSSSLFPYHRYQESSPVVLAIYDGSFIYALRTPSITQQIHDHFNCSTVNYAPLENAGGAGTAGSHWEARMFNHELMQGFISYDYMVISNFTWHFFHDSNWYDVDYEFTNSNALEYYEFNWGKGEGCGIITGDCDDEDVYKYKCANVGNQSCTAERLGMGTCISSAAFDSCQVVRTASNGACIFDIHYSNETDDLFYLAQKYGEQSRCFEVWDLEECKYSPGCYGTQIYKYQPTNQFAYQIMGQEGVTDGPVWCYEGRHVEVGVDYVLCPPISEIQLHFGVQDIIDINDYVPPPLCHESCLSCALPQDDSMCLECSSGYMLSGEAPSSCNGSAEIMDPTEGCGVEPTDPPTPPDTGCTAAFPNGCCTENSCKTPEGCYCDYGCHESNDCCSDIEETCPKNPITTTTTAKKSSTTKAITSTIPEVTTTEAITSTSSVIPEVTTTEAITSTSSVIPEVTTTEAITSTSSVIPEITTTEAITSTSSVIPEVTTTEIVPTLTTTSLSTTPFPTATPSPTPMVCQDDEARIGNDDVVEWCRNGTWESICYSSSWDFKNAIVLCNELDMPSSGAYIDWTPASDEAVLSHVQGIDCTGTEDSLSECSYTEQEGLCQSNQVVKAYCIQGLANCEQCDKLVECAVEGIARDTYSEPIGSILACTVQFSDPDLSTSTLDEFSEIKFLTGLSTSLIRQFGLISREQTRAIQQQCNVSGEYPQHGDPIQTLQEMGIETLRILYENADGFASVRDFTHSEIRNSITRGDFLDLFHDESIGCSFQHLLYWLTRVPTLAPAYCRVEEGRTTLIDSLIHCNSPFQQCLDATESEGYESGNYYPVVGNDDKINIIQCQ